MMNLNVLRISKMHFFAALCVFILGIPLAGATDFKTAIAGRIFCDENCNGKVDIGVDVQLLKVKVELLDQNGNVIATTTPEVYGGTYIFPDLVAGKKYSVRVVPSMGQTVINSFPSQNAIKNSKFKITVTAVQQDVTYYPNDFLLECCPETWNQCEWGTDTCGVDPIDLLRVRFIDFYPNGVVIGGQKTLTFTNVNAILRFLPAYGNPRKLIMTRVDPLYNSESSFAGNVLALVLNIKLSDEGITSEGLGDKVFDSGPFSGMTLRDFALLANRILGGETNLLPNCMSISTFNCWVEWVNNNDWCHCSRCEGDDDDDDDRDGNCGRDHRGDCRDDDGDHKCDKGHKQECNSDHRGKCDNDRDNKCNRDHSGGCQDDDNDRKCDKGHQRGCDGDHRGDCDKDRDNKCNRDHNGGCKDDDNDRKCDKGHKRNCDGKDGNNGNCKGGKRCKG